MAAKPVNGRPVLLRAVLVEDQPRGPRTRFATVEGPDGDRQLVAADPGAVIDVDMLQGNDPRITGALASGLTVTIADGLVWLRFHDRREAVFAAAQLSPADTLACAEQLTDAVEELRDHPPAAAAKVH